MERGDEARSRVAGAERGRIGYSVSTSKHDSLSILLEMVIFLGRFVFIEPWEHSRGSG